MTAQVYATFNNISLPKFSGNPIYGLARASQIEFNDFLGPRLFSVTFKVMKMKKFWDYQRPVKTLEKRLPRNNQ